MSNSIISANQAHQSLVKEIQTALVRMKEQGPDAETDRGKSCFRRVLDFAPGAHPTAALLADLLACQSQDLIDKVCKLWSKDIDRLVLDTHTSQSPLSMLLTTHTAHALSAAEGIGFDLAKVRHSCLSHALGVGDAEKVSYLHRRFGSDLIVDAAHLALSIQKCHPDCAQAFGLWITEFGPNIPCDRRLEIFVQDSDVINGSGLALKILSVFAGISPASLAQLSLGNLGCPKALHLWRSLNSNHGRLSVLASLPGPVEILATNIAQTKR